MMMKMHPGNGTARRRTVIAMLLSAVVVAVPAGPVGAIHPAEQQVVVFEEAEVFYDPELLQPKDRSDHVLLRNGQVVQRTITLPTLAGDLADARRIVATIVVEPVVTKKNGRLRPGDPWTRMGSVSLVRPGAELRPVALPAEEADRLDKTENRPGPEVDEIELMRFITGFGGATTFQQDLTELAPLLSGEQTIRLYLSTYMQPAWKVSLKLAYSSDGVGPRRPAFAEPLFNDQSVEADSHTLVSTVTIPEGLSTPRIRILSTGHATDGTDGDEFTARTNELSIDGGTIAMFRPWSEQGGTLREVNPTSGRVEIEGRELWSSDLDRAGWHPGQIVQPRLIPAPELTPGRHTVRLQVHDIRPEDESGLGYWRVSAIVVADEPWPEVDAERSEGQQDD